MTPARLQALIDVDEYARDLAENPRRSSRPATAHPSADPAADLAALARM